MSVMNKPEDIDKVLQPLEQMLKYNNEMRVIFSDPARQAVISVFEMMKDNLKIAVVGTVVKAGQKEVEAVVQVTAVIIDVLVERPITEFFKNMVVPYLDLVNNWNQQIAKNDGITNSIRYSKRILEDNMTISDSIGVMRNLLAKLRREQQYRPPAYELSKHYLKELQDKILQNRLKNEEKKKETSSCTP